MSPHFLVRPEELDLDFSRGLRAEHAGRGRDFPRRDLAILYPVFSARVQRIFASGTLGSFVPVFARCYNAPAHWIPHILEWMDRSDIAGLNAPRPLALHYSALDVPGPKINSAAYNETVEPALSELREIYRAFGAESGVKLIVTPDRGHEMDLRALLEFLA